MGQASRGLLDDEDVANAAKDVDVTFTINPEYAARLEVFSLWCPASFNPLVLLNKSMIEVAELLQLCSIINRGKNGTASRRRTPGSLQE